jgi:hypothetical protein
VYLGGRESLINDVSDRLSSHARKLIVVEASLLGQKILVDLLGYLLINVPDPPKHSLSMFLRSKTKQAADQKHDRAAIIRECMKTVLEHVTSPGWCVQARRYFDARLHGSGHAESWDTCARGAQCSIVKTLSASLHHKKDPTRRYLKEGSRSCVGGLGVEQHGLEKKGTV